MLKEHVFQASSKREVVSSFERKPGCQREERRQEGIAAFLQEMTFHVGPRPQPRPRPRTRGRESQVLDHGREADEIMRSLHFLPPAGENGPFPWIRGANVLDKR